MRGVQILVEILQALFGFSVFHRVVFDAHFVAGVVHIEIMNADLQIGTVLLVSKAVFLVDHLNLSLRLGLVCIIVQVLDDYEVAVCC